MTVDSLGNLPPGSHLYAFCDHCRRSVELDASALVERLGANFPVTDLRNRLTCRECGGRAVFRRSFSGDGGN